MDTAAAAAVWVASIVAGLGALGWLGKKTIAAARWLVQLGRKLDKLADLANYELAHNGGMSIKDAAALIRPMKKALDEHLETSARIGAEFEARLDALEGQRAKTIADLAEALPVVAKSTPPAEENGTQS